MYTLKHRIPLVAIMLFTALLLLYGCKNEAAKESEKQTPERRIGVVLDTGGDRDKGYNEHTLRGVQKAAKAAGIEVKYIVSESMMDYENNVESLILEGADLIVTVGFTMGNITSKAAQKNKNVHFVIVDFAYYPGAGCADTVEDCYTKEGGLENVTSLLFAEDEAGYLAGALAACMTKSNVIATVSGMEIPPVWKFVLGYQHGARSVKPDIQTLNQYIPDFNDPESGKTVGQKFIQKGADIVFAVGGSTGNGALLAAKNAGIMGIGVDIDQYNTFEEVKDILLTSAMKNMDVAAATAIEAYSRGELKSGVNLFTLSNNGVGLAPYHDMEGVVPQQCKDIVEKAIQDVIGNPNITGAK